MTLTPEQLGITPEHITQIVRCPRLFSVTVHELASDVETMRACRDALIDGRNVIACMTVLSGLDEEVILKRIEDPTL